MVKDGGKAVRHAQGLEMERSRMVSLEPEGRNQQTQVTSGRKMDLRETRWGELGQRVEKHKRKTGERRRNQTGQTYQGRENT